MAAFEHGFAQTVEIEPGVFVGVHTDTIKHFKATQTAGVWTVGSICIPDLKV